MATLYEIEVIAADGRKGLVAYAGRRSKAGLRAAVHQRAAALLRFLKSDKATMEPVAKHSQHQHDISGGHLVRFSGRTKLDAKAAPLTYIGEN